MFIWLLIGVILGIGIGVFGFAGFMCGPKPQQEPDATSAPPDTRPLVQVVLNATGQFSGLVLMEQAGADAEKLRKLANMIAQWDAAKTCVLLTDDPGYRIEFVSAAALVTPRPS
jgi:hypothetical protein